MNYASKEEEYFDWWLEELAPFGVFSLKKYQPKPFVLFSGSKIEYQVQMKTKIKTKSQTLLTGHEYQADFLVHWNPKFKNKVFFDYTDISRIVNSPGEIRKIPFVANYSDKKDIYFSVIDVKGTFNQNDAWRRFAIDQKWVFSNYGVYVQKIITHPSGSGKKLIPANALFPNTFVPEKFMVTEKKKQLKKINYPFQTSMDYVLSL